MPSYADGDAVSNLVLTPPLTTFAVAYQEYLQASGPGRGDGGGAVGTARAAMETSFGGGAVASDLTPQASRRMTTFNGGRATG
ncbi:MAG: hypothetical protein HS111_12910 [Kofleriaceae bacterium]|nr:hypothetical protein [Kofleriaceae bacterium]